MTSRPVVIGPGAEADIATIDAWWSENRLAAPDLFFNELQHALALIASPHYVGPRYLNCRYPGMRRYLMRSTRYQGAVRGVTPGLTHRKKRIEGS